MSWYKNILSARHTNGVQSTLGICISPEISLGMGSANERRRYKLTSSVIGWVHTWNTPRVSGLHATYTCHPGSRRDMSDLIKVMVSFVMNGNTHIGLLPWLQIHCEKLQLIAWIGCIYQHGIVVVACEFFFYIDSILKLMFTIFMNKKSK